MPTGHCFYAASTVSATAHSRYTRCRRANRFNSRRNPPNVDDAERLLGIFNKDLDVGFDKHNVCVSISIERSLVVSEPIQRVMLAP